MPRLRARRIALCHGGVGRAWVWLWSILAVSASCGGSGGGPAASANDAGSGEEASAPDAAAEATAADASSDAAAPPVDSAPPPPPAKCTTSFVGTALTGTFGRMDGHLAAVVPTNGSHACRADSGHVHLQIKMNGVVYDVAVNTDTLVAQKDIALPGGAWAEGWHGAEHLDYPTNLNLHSADFQTTSIQTAVETALAGADQVSVFATPYDPTGAHDVHRKSGGDDGAIFVNPSSPQAHVLAFRFSTDAF
jgi:hypothetical protein